ncbi:heat shock 70 kDa protein 12B-like isoform X2 [Mya arenaria]|uniref:heat shock 70 kDa protein 12B-like isoform X2 n=1 Tax=Mya arenaria TaxID=6604 RepID=UPI0022E7D945|nr:heat shock 70 kDa protein 12B-like isoform X2 [Mya arenaria]
MSETRINEIIVAAIDFGTTFSGYAYSYREEYLRDPLQIYSNRWDGQILPQAPTVLLFNSEKTESYFGFEKLTRKMTIKDAQGRNMPAVEVFAAAIRHLKNHFMEQAKLRVNIQENEVRWVITVPAIWSDDAKEFMVVAAEMAGIKEDKLSLAYEPEAAAIYCKHMRLAKLREPGKDATIQPFPTGLKFLVLDLGGGTVDISAHQVQDDGSLKALREPSGGKWGGTLVDDGFLEIFEGLFGADFMTGLKSDIEQAESKRELDAEIEMKKRTIVGKSNAKANNVISIKLPFALLEGTKSAQFESALESGIYELIQGKLLIDNSILLSAFENSVSKIVEHLNFLLGKTELERLDAVVMVGGFSDSKVVQEAIKDVLENYPNVDLIIPENSASAIVHGAVLYGFNPSVISTRKSKYSYGISTSAPFVEELHPLSHRVQRDGSNQCEDIFKVFVKKGEEVIPGQTTATHEFNPSPLTRENQTIEVYKSEEDEPPKFVTECQKVGLVCFTVPDSDFDVTTVRVDMKFGGTQMTVSAVVNGPNGSKSVEAFFDWL